MTNYPNTDDIIPLSGQQRATLQSACSNVQVPMQTAVSLGQQLRLILGRYASFPEQILLRYGRGGSRPKRSSQNLAIGMPAARLALQHQLIMAL